MVPTRRQTLTALGATVTGTAGCFGISDPDLVVENNRDRSLTIDVKITRMSDMRVVVWADRTIGSDDTTVFGNPMDQPDEYRIRILASKANVGGEETFQIDNVDTAEIRAVIGSKGVTFTRKHH